MDHPNIAKAHLQTAGLLCDRAVEAVERGEFDTAANLASDAKKRLSDAQHELDETLPQGEQQS